MKKSILLMALVALLSACTIPSNQNTSTQAVSVASNSNQVQQYEGKIKGYDGKDFYFDVQAGQKITVNIVSNAPYAYFNVFEPNGTEAIFNSSTSGEKFSWTASKTGKYKAHVYQMRASARRNQTVPFQLKIAIQ